MLNTVSTQANLTSEVLGKEYLPEGGLLLIPNRLGMEDLLLLEAQLAGRSVAYLFRSACEYSAAINGFLQKDEVKGLELTCGDEHRDAFKQEIQTCVSKGDVVVFIPSEVNARCAQTTCVPTSVVKFLVAAGVAVVPLFVEHLAETKLAVESDEEAGGTVLSFGECIEARLANSASYFENLLVASERAFSQRPILKSSLAFT